MLEKSLDFVLGSSTKTKDGAVIEQSSRLKRFGAVEANRKQRHQLSHCWSTSHGYFRNKIYIFPGLRTFDDKVLDLFVKDTAHNLLNGVANAQRSRQLNLEGTRLRSLLSFDYGLNSLVANCTNSSRNIVSTKGSGGIWLQALHPLQYSGWGRRGRTRNMQNFHDIIVAITIRYNNSQLLLFSSSNSSCHDDIAFLI